MLLSCHDNASHWKYAYWHYKFTKIRQHIDHLTTVTVSFHFLLINNVLLQFMSTIAISLTLGFPYLSSFTFLNLNLFHKSHTKTSIRVISSIQMLLHHSNSIPVTFPGFLFSKIKRKTL